MKSTFFLSLLLTLTTSIASALPLADGWAEVGVDGGNRRTIGRLQTLLPIFSVNQGIAFGYVRGLIDSDTNSEGNFGVGYRTLCGNFVVGAYGFYDVRRVLNRTTTQIPCNGTKIFQHGTEIAQTEISHRIHDRHTFHQISGGIEGYTRCFEARINGYAALSGEHFIPGSRSGEATVVNNRVIGTCRSDFTRNLSGFDAEVGYRYCPCNPCDCWYIPEVHLLAGGYYFHRKGYETLGGPRGRALLIWNNLPLSARFTLGVEGNRDDIQGGQVAGIARLEIPFCGRRRCPPCSLGERLYHRIDRLDVTTRRATFTCVGPATINGQEIGPVTTITALTPDPEIVASNAGPGSLVVFDGVNGVINTTDPLVMNNQQVYAGACDQVAVGILGCPCDQVLLDIPGVRPIVEKPGTNGPVVEMAPDAVITGIHFVGGGSLLGPEAGATILANADPRVTIMKSETTSNTDDTDGIRLQAGSNNAIVMNNVITTGGGTGGGNGQSEGVHANASTNVLVKENAIFTSGFSSEGIFFENGSDNGIAKGNSIKVTGPNAEGVRIEGSDNVSVLNNNGITTSGVNGEGVQIHGGSDGTLVSNNTILTTGASASGAGSASGIIVEGGSDGTQILGNTLFVSGAGSEGIFLDGGATGINNTVINDNRVTVVGAGGDGLKLEDNDNTSGSRNTFISILDDAVDINDATNLSGTDNVIIIVGDNACQAGGTNSGEIQFSIPPGGSCP